MAADLRGGCFQNLVPTSLRGIYVTERGGFPSMDLPILAGHSLRGAETLWSIRLVEDLDIDGLRDSSCGKL